MTVLGPHIHTYLWDFGGTWRSMKCNNMESRLHEMKSSRCVDQVLIMDSISSGMSCLVIRWSQNGSQMIAGLFKWYMISLKKRQWWQWVGGFMYTKTSTCLSSTDYIRFRRKLYQSPLASLAVLLACGQWGVLYVEPFIYSLSHLIGNFTLLVPVLYMYITIWWLKYLIIFRINPSCGYRIFREKKRGQYHGCWCPGSICCHVITSHDMHYMNIFSF